MLLHVAPPDGSYAAPGGSVLGDVYLAAIGLLVGLVVAYLVYKIASTGRRDYGLPVKRRLLCTRLRVDSDQSAQVPFWWTERQVQHVMRAHWRHTLRLPLASGDPQKSGIDARVRPTALPTPEAPSS
jgi:hypothetical protein